MRRRLAFSYVLLLVLVLAALEVPLAIALTTRDSQRMALDRLADAARFATLAEPALRTNELEALRAELVRYDEVYGISVAVINREQRIEAKSRDVLNVGGAAVQDEIRRALDGEQSGGTGTVWPWRSSPMVVAAPVGSGGETLAAVVIISPTDRLRAQVGTAWLVLAGGGVLALAVCIAAALALARWTLRPIAELDTAVHHIADGDYAARVPPHSGPPELRRLALAFNEMVDTVSDALARQRAFVAQASHQLRNPLTALRLRVEALAETTDAEEGQLALQETDRLANVLDGMLALARAERGRFRIESIDADAVTAERVAAWQPLARQRSITLRHEPAPEAVKARAVTTAVDQSLDALIDNALKFAGPGATVTVRTAPEEDGVAVHVVDDGPGLSPEQLARATERFWRAPTAQNTEGSGLGLPIVAVLIEASGGRVELKPATPKGLHARLWFPPG